MRPKTEEERRQAQSHVDRVVVPSTAEVAGGAIFFAIIGTGILGAIAFLLSSGWPALVEYLAVVLFLGLLGSFVLAYRRGQGRRQALQHEHDRLEQEVRSGQVEWARFHVVEVVMILSEPPALCYYLGDGQALLLRTWQARRHPSAEFEVVRLPASKLILGCPTLGPEIPLAAQLPEEIDSRSRTEAEPFAIDWDAVRAGTVSF